MNITEIPLVGLLRERMSWLNARQAVLSQNVANADAPGYTARDLKPMDFEALVKRASNTNISGLTATNPHHITITSDNPGGFEQDNAPDTEAINGNNSVSLEQEMIKVADTQAEYQAAANLYSKAIGLIRTAIGKNSG
ncbi:MAG: flagellar basal body rod protein FlgB [Proteobacteria bacterium]|nr:flagellar basal body rod protein FlgB [Pseudomonadota bacterium]